MKCFGISCSDGSALVSAVRNNNQNNNQNKDHNTEEVARIIDKEVKLSKTEVKQDTRILSNEVKHLYKVDPSVSCALTGIPSDCRHILGILRKEAQEYRMNFGTAVPLKTLAEKVSSYLHSLTLPSDMRPLAVTILISARFNLHQYFPCYQWFFLPCY